VRKISATAYMAERTPGITTRQNVLDLLLELIDSGSVYGTPPKRDLLYGQIIDHARRVLGVKELTELRSSLIQRSG
jgi:hypothetical protein